MRNRYPGVCYRCLGQVEPGEGHFEKHGRRWLTQHASCAIIFRGTGVGKTEPCVPRPTVTEIEDLTVKIIQKSISAGLTINLGNYESLRIDSTVTVEVGADQDLAALRLEMLAEMRTDLAAAYREFSPKGKTGEQVAAQPVADDPTPAPRTDGKAAKSGSLFS